jgi:aerobic C4-dicarboxylate transport protein
MSSVEIAPAEPRSRSTLRRLPPLWVQVLVGMLIGALLGYLNPDVGAKMQPFGDAFIKLIRMLIAPLIFCTVTHGIARMTDMTRVGRVAIKALIYFEVITTIALVISLVVVNLWQPGVGMNIDLSKVNTSTLNPYIAHMQHVDVVSFLMGILPNSFVGAFVEGNVLQVLLLAVLCGMALTWLGERGKPIVDFTGNVSQMLFQIVGIVMWVAPIGAFGALAFAVAKFGPESLVYLGKLVVGFCLFCAVFIFAVFGPIARYCGFRLWKLIRYLQEELLIVLATTSTETVLPRLLVKMRRAGCDEGVVGLVIPTGYSFNLDGTCLYLATTAIFLAQATNTSLDVWQQIGLLMVLLLTSKGAAGVAGAAFVVLAATLASAGTIPVASVALILGVHRLLAEGFTPVNLIGNAVATIFIAKWENALDHGQLKRVLDGTADVVPVA